MTESGRIPSSTSAPAQRRWVGAAMLRLVGFALLWWVLAEGSLRYPVMGLLAVAGATAASLALMPPGDIRLSPVGLALFVPYFARQSVIGGVDVAMRALSPRMPLDPGFVECDLRLPDEAARVLLAHVMSLMPGSLSVELDGRRLRLHVLDHSMPVIDRVREAEALVAGIFGIDVPDNAPESTGGLARDGGRGR